MTLAPIADQEGALLNWIETLGSLAWRKYQQRHPSIWRNNGFEVADHSGHPPFISFRFDSENAELVARLKAIVENYQGAIPWAMTAHSREPLPGTNWSICPRHLDEVRHTAIATGLSPGEYLAEKDPTFGPKAYTDLIPLEAHLRRVFDL